MLQRVLKQHKTHKRIIIIILLQAFLHNRRHFLIRHLIKRSFRIYAHRKITKNEIHALRVLLTLIRLEIPHEGKFRKLLLHYFEHIILIRLQVIEGNESIAVRTFAFVNPESDDFIRLLVSIGLREQHALVYVGDVSEVEFVMEVDGGFFEFLGNGVVQEECGADDLVGLFEDRGFEFLELSVEEGDVYEVQGLVIGERNGDRPEVTLVSGVHGERTRGGVHGRQHLRVNDVLLGKFRDVVPMPVVRMLSQQRDGGLRVIGIQLRHIEIIDEINHLQFSRGTELLSCLFFQRLFQLYL